MLLFLTTRRTKDSLKEGKVVKKVKNKCIETFNMTSEPLAEWDKHIIINKL